MQKIDPADLIPFDIFENEPIKVDVVYADANHPRNIFVTAIYQPKTRLWAHKDLATITLLMARTLNKKHGYIVEVKDCLRTTDAQSAMQETDIVKAHPEWMEEPMMLSPPGGGGHPRAMAIDVCLLDKGGKEVDMGTPFDDMDKKSYRSCTDLTDEQMHNRTLLETTFVDCAKQLGFNLLPIPSEWWDFRFYPEYTQMFEPISDNDLPKQMQQTKRFDNNIIDFDQSHFENLKQKIIQQIEKF